MKKLSLLSLFLLLSLSAFSQSGVKFGVRVGLASTMNRINDMDKDDGVTFSKYKNSFGFTFGPQIDFGISDNAAIVTGLWFTTLNTSYNASILSVADYYVVNNSQYITLPIGFKGYTNEIMTDGKIYFSCLGTIDVKVAEKFKDSDIDNFDYEQYQTLFGGGVQIASGLDLKLGESTAVYGGIFFNHDLFNRAGAKHIDEDDDDSPKYNDLLSVKRSQIGLEVGVKF